MKRIITGLLSLAQEFAPTLTFSLASHFWDFRAAVILSVAVTLALAARLLVRHEKPTEFFLFSIGLTCLFAAVDLTCQTPFMFRYEAVITNVVTGGFFLQSCFRGTPVITQFAARTHDVGDARAQAYLRGLTMVWALQFFVKALVYLWVVEHFSLGEALVIRACVGKVFFWGLLLGERALRVPLCRLLARWNLLPAA